MNLQTGIQSNQIDIVTKRALDIILSLLGLILVSPIFIFVPILLRRDSPGPVFFKGKRIGKDGKIFDILKFRTMYETPESYNGPKLTAQDDPRVTPLGARLRATKINEFPQLWNVLIGDMSLVGPRPEDPDLAEEWPEAVRNILLSVRPGITSPASVVYRDLEGLLHSDSVIDEYLQSVLPTKMRLDTLYVRNRSILTDLDVLFWTAIALLPKIRKTNISEARLYWGPIARFVTNHFRWFVVDSFVTLVSVTLVGIVWRTISPLHIGWFWAPIITMAMSITFGISNTLMGLNQIYWSKARASDALELAFSSVISVTLLILLNRFVFVEPAVPIGLFLFGGLFAFFGFLSVRYRERIITGMAARWLGIRRGGKIVGERVLIVGAGELGEFAIWLLQKGDLAMVFNIIGMVDDAPKKQNMRIDGYNVLGTTEDITSLVADQDIGLILFAISNISHDQWTRVIKICEGTTSRVIMIPNVIKTMREYFSTGLKTGTLPDPYLPPFEQVDWLDTLDTLLAAGEIIKARALIAQVRGKSSENIEMDYEDVLER